MFWLQLLQQRSACGAPMDQGPMDPSVFKLSLLLMSHLTPPPSPFVWPFRAVCFGELPHPAFYRAVSRRTVLLLFFLVPSSYFELLLTSLCLNMARKRSLVIISADLTLNIFTLFPAVTNWLHLFGSDAVPTVSLQPPTAESRQNALAASFCSS